MWCLLFAALITRVARSGPGDGRQADPVPDVVDMNGRRREDLIDGLEKPPGATTALLEAQCANTLFI
jgi:hypothetical protein